MVADAATATRTFTVSTSDYSLAGDYSLTVTPKTATAEDAISGVTLTIALKITDPCEPPGITASTVAVSTYQLNRDQITIAWPAWTLNPSTCSITYAVSIPSAISSIAACNVNSKTCNIVGDYTKTSTVGSHSITVTGVT